MFTPLNDNTLINFTKNIYDAYDKHCTNCNSCHNDCKLSELCIESKDIDTEIRYTKLGIAIALLHLDSHKVDMSCITKDSIWKNVEVDAPVFVRYDNERDIWLKRHFAKYEDGEVYIFQFGHTSFSTDCEPIKCTTEVELYNGEGHVR